MDISNSNGYWLKKNKWQPKQNSSPKWASVNYNFPQIFFFPNPIWYSNNICFVFPIWIIIETNKFLNFFFYKQKSNKWFEYFSFSNRKNLQTERMRKQQRLIRILLVNNNKNYISFSSVNLFQGKKDWFQSFKTIN